MFTAGKFLVAGVNRGLLATTAVVKHGLINVAARDADLLAMLHVGDGTMAYGLFDRLFDVVAVTPQETLTVYRAFILAIEASVDHIAHKALRAASSCELQAASRSTARVFLLAA